VTAVTPRTWREHLHAWINWDDGGESSPLSALRERLPVETYLTHRARWEGESIGGYFRLDREIDAMRGADFPQYVVDWLEHRLADLQKWLERDGYEFRRIGLRRVRIIPPSALEAEDLELAQKLEDAFNVAFAVENGAGIDLDDVEPVFAELFGVET
jgi:hypothetical protein